jgi:hypothetical protein
MKDFKTCSVNKKSTQKVFGNIKVKIVRKSQNRQKKSKSSEKVKIVRKSRQKIIKTISDDFDFF